MQTLFASRAAGLAGAFLLGISYDHVVWGGFILTETTGVLFLLLFLNSLFWGLEKRVGYFSFNDILTGVLFCCAVFLRYEYILLVLPVGLLVIQKSPNPLPKLLTILSTFLFCSTIIIALFYPLQGLFQIFMDQSRYILEALAGLFIFSTIAYFLYISVIKMKKQEIKPVVPVVLMVFLIAIAYLYPALRDFVRYDTAIAFLSLIGFFLLARNAKHFPLLIFIIFSCLLLGISYYRTNPDMLRYMTHVIPFLLIPACYIVTGQMVTKPVSSIGDVRRKIFLSICFLLIIYQIVLSYQGIRYRDNGVWFGGNYEEKVASQILQENQTPNHLLLASLPEPYYFITHTDTYSVADEPPFIYIDSSLDNKTVLIVEDEGMRSIFPHFTKFLHKKLISYKTSELNVKGYYFEMTNYSKVKKPVVIYEIKLKELRLKIKASGFPPSRE